MKLTTEDGTESGVGSRADLERALATLGREGNGFAVLERGEKGHFMQAATTGTSRFLVEYREGGDGAHFQSERTDLSISEVLRLFSSYREGTRAHVDAIAWSPVGGVGARALTLAPGPSGDRTARAMIGLIVLGVALSALALVLGLRARAFQQRAARASGTVVRLEPASSKKGNTSVFPVVRFDAPDGRSTTFRGNLSGSAREYRVGQRLLVLYDPADPAHARLASSSGASAAEPILVGVMGGLFCAIGAGALLLRTVRLGRAPLIAPRAPPAAPPARRRRRGPSAPGR